MSLPAKLIICFLPVRTCVVYQLVQIIVWQRKQTESVFKVQNYMCADGKKFIL